MAELVCFYNASTAPVWLAYLILPIILVALVVERRQRIEAALRESETRLRQVAQSEEALQASLRAKELLLRELQHRVRNNLQVICSLLSLQATHVQDEQARRMFRASQDRVKSIALVHEKFYHSPDLERIAFADCARRLVLNLFHAYGVDAGAVALDLSADNVFLNLDTAVPCALIINELVSNALKHAFPAGRRGALSINLRPADDDHLTLEVRDDGVGLPGALDVGNSPSFGLQLVRTLTDQLDGKLEWRNGQGTAFLITFNELFYKKRR